MMIYVDLIWKHLNLGALTRKSVALSVIIAAAKVSSSYQWLGTSVDRFEIFKIWKSIIGLKTIKDHESWLTQNSWKLLKIGLGVDIEEIVGLNGLRRA